MKKLKGSPAAKTIAVILLCALCLAFAGSALAVGMLYSAGYYTKSEAAAREDLAQSLCASEAWNIVQRVVPLKTEGGNNPELAGSANFRYEIFDRDGALRARTWDGEDAIAVVTIPGGNWYPYIAFARGSFWGEEEAEEGDPGAEPLPTPLPDGIASVSVPVQTTPPLEEPLSTPQLAQEPLPTPPPRPNLAEVTPTPRIATPGDVYGSPGDMSGAARGRTVEFTVVCYLLRDMTQKDNAWYQRRCFELAAANDRALIGAAGASALLALLVFLFLMGAAGRRRGTDEIAGRFAEKIPFDLFTVLIAAGLLLVMQLLDKEINRGSFVIQLAVVVFAVLAAALLGLWWCMSLAVRVKQKTLLRGTICYKLLRLAGRALKALWGWLKTLIVSIPLVWRGLLVYGGAAFVGLIAAMANRRDALGLWFSGNLLLFPLVLWALVAARRLRDGAKEIADGNTAYTVPTKYLFGEAKRHAEDLNRIQSGISRAVDERLRSERMKTELITNVSHDIKTPLTSIVSYVDLLSKEEIDNEKAREYIAVLQRQSARLKKLTDDLVEASKASSGALPTTLERCELGVMLEQTAGEYGERLAGKELTLVLRRPEREVFVRADVRHTQRIFDNLMNNILKYALPGTRVYLELTEETNGAAVIFRNTSRSEIVQSPEELTERFVRGDASRSSEGSGLGLSIARSLAELQGGSLSVTVDGDLFKVTLGFAGE